VTSPGAVLLEPPPPSCRSRSCFACSWAPIGAAMFATGTNGCPRGLEPRPRIGKAPTMRRSLVFAALLIAGCVLPFPITTHNDSLRARASFDMRCPVAELHVTDLGPSTAGVDGCGQRGTYIFSSAAGAWVLNSPGAEQNQALFEAPPGRTSNDLPGVPPGSPPGTLPGSAPGTLPGAPPGSPPGTPPGLAHH
jgi:hypothetical protein